MTSHDLTQETPSLEALLKSFRATSAARGKERHTSALELFGRHDIASWWPDFFRQLEQAEQSACLQALAKNLMSIKWPSATVLNMAPHFLAPVEAQRKVLGAIIQMAGAEELLSIAIQLSAANTKPKPTGYPYNTLLERYFHMQGDARKVVILSEKFVDHKNANIQTQAKSNVSLCASIPAGDLHHQAYRRLIELGGSLSNVDERSNTFPKFYSPDGSWSESDPKQQFLAGKGSSWAIYAGLHLPGKFVLTTGESAAALEFGGGSENFDLNIDGARRLLTIIAIDEHQFFYCVDLGDTTDFASPRIYKIDHDGSDGRFLTTFDAFLRRLKRA